MYNKNNDDNADNSDNVKIYRKIIIKMIILY